MGLTRWPVSDSLIGSLMGCIMKESVRSNYDTLEEVITSRAAELVKLGGFNSQEPVLLHALPLLKLHRQNEAKAAAKRIPRPRLAFDTTAAIAPLFQEVTAFLQRRSAQAAALQQGESDMESSKPQDNLMNVA